MGNFLHRTTKAYHQSAPPDALPEPIGEYIENPDMSAVTGYPSIYWIITGDLVTLMSQAERDAVDAQRLSDTRDGIIAQLDQVEDIQRQLLIMEVGEFNKLRQWLVDFQAAVASAGNLGQLQSAVATLPTLNPITFAQVKTQLRNALGS
jgi:hypothetical protein